MYCTEHRVLENNNHEPGEKKLYYVSAMTQIKEETEYIKKMRITLQKMRQQLFEDKDGVTDGQQTQEMKRPMESPEVNESEPCMAELCSKYRRIMSQIKVKDAQLRAIQWENKELLTKLEATREAGAAAIRNASQKLFEHYQKQMDELRQQHEEEKHKLQAFAEDQEENLERSVENYNNLVLKLQQKQNRAMELEKLIERMEKEKKELIERKQSVEKEMEWKKSSSMDVPDNIMRFQDLQLEISILQEKILHLDNVVTQQHRNLYSVINTIENLKMDLAKQDQIILSLREQVGLLEAENRELKYKAEVYSDKQSKKPSPVSCASYESARNKTPYQLLMKWKKSF
ncbi:coiled-coil domain-containing protein 68-like isoform X1 [Carcharodon carcharias]|uniref:coiled-coil domain-containing protein 68-like isoform X1 n=3 Tax=Carcharodon carcharias TaxID=13397 RepID=UPI001B7EB323|nr:coiled-coil domain-containing protein 68-like isoform X1 [Carcharodon carcharias]XP_041046979.1 coiled-coil domain-containing protein 68-like isoform X1 [Carcharodon carcharias]